MRIFALMFMLKKYFTINIIMSPLRKVYFNHKGHKETTKGTILNALYSNPCVFCENLCVFCGEKKMAFRSGLNNA
jgi:hypothetical protein